MRPKAVGAAAGVTERVLLNTEFSENAEEERVWMDLAGDRQSGARCGAEDWDLQKQGTRWCDRTIVNDSRNFDYCQGTVPAYLSFE